jgi:hypothetical protein
MRRRRNFGFSEIALTPSPNQVFHPRHPVPHEGRSRSSRTLERDAVDAAASARRSRRAGYSVSDRRTRKTTALKRLSAQGFGGTGTKPIERLFRRRRGRRSRVVLAPVAGVKSRGGFGGPTGCAKPFNPRGDGGKKELVTRESAKETVKTIRVRECRAISGASAVNTRAQLSLPSAYGAAGALGARYSPRPLSKGANVICNLGRNPCRGAKKHVSHRVAKATYSKKAFSTVIVRESGRSSIPEASAMESTGRGVLDTRFRGHDGGAWGALPLGRVVRGVGRKRTSGKRCY